MTNAQQNMRDSRTQQQRMDPPFEVRWSSQGGERELMAGAARWKREPSQVGVDVSDRSS